MMPANKQNERRGNKKKLDGTNERDRVNSVYSDELPRFDDISMWSFYDSSYPFRPIYLSSVASFELSGVVHHLFNVFKGFVSFVWFVSLTTNDPSFRCLSVKCAHCVWIYQCQTHKRNGNQKAVIHILFIFFYFSCALGCFLFLLFDWIDCNAFGMRVFVFIYLD